jgi:hypothetical protein
MVELYMKTKDKLHALVALIRSKKRHNTKGGIRCTAAHNTLANRQITMTTANQTKILRQLQQLIHYSKRMAK